MNRTIQVIPGEPGQGLSHADSVTGVTDPIADSNIPARPIPISATMTLQTRRIHPTGPTVTLHQAPEMLRNNLARVPSLSLNATTVRIAHAKNARLHILKAEKLPAIPPTRQLTKIHLQELPPRALIRAGARRPRTITLGTRRGLRRSSPATSGSNGRLSRPMTGERLRTTTGGLLPLATGGFRQPMSGELLRMRPL